MPMFNTIIYNTDYNVLSCISFIPCRNDIHAVTCAVHPSILANIKSTFQFWIDLRTISEPFVCVQLSFFSGRGIFYKTQYLTSCLLLFLFGKELKPVGHQFDRLRASKKLWNCIMCWRRFNWTHEYELGYKYILGDFKKALQAKNFDNVTMSLIYSKRTIKLELFDLILIAAPTLFNHRLDIITTTIVSRRPRHLQTPYPIKKLLWQQVYTDKVLSV